MCVTHAKCKNLNKIWKSRNKKGERLRGGGSSLDGDFIIYFLLRWFWLMCLSIKSDYKEEERVELRGMKK